MKSVEKKHHPPQHILNLIIHCLNNAYFIYDNQQTGAPMDIRTVFKLQTTYISSLVGNPKVKTPQEDVGVYEILSAGVTGYKWARLIAESKK